MEGKITKEEFDSIKQIFHNLNFAFADYEYLSTYGLNIIKAAFIDQNQTFFRRIKYYLFHFTIIELNKLFDNSEDHSIKKFINHELRTRKEDDMKQELSWLNEQIKRKPTKAILKRVNALRNKVSAHLDADRDQIKQTKILVSEIKVLINIARRFVSIFNEIVEGKQYQSLITEDVLGYKLHEQYFESIIRR